MNKKGGLGRGLGSLIPNRTMTPITNPVLVSNENFNVPKEILNNTNGQLISEIPLENITVNPHQPRHIFNETAIEELANSIKENGLMQPLVVTKINQNKFELIAGERRFRACKKLGLATVMAIVRDATEQQKLELAIIENIQRENLNPLEEAKAYARLNNEFNLTHEQIAKQTGKSRSQITNIIRLLNLPLEIQNALESNKITIGHAKTIASLPTETEQLALFKSIISGHLNVRETESLASRSNKKSLFKNNPIQDPNIKNQESTLASVLGTKVKISGRGTHGKIEIEYYSAEELNNIVDKIIS